jgi:hypothetical protein
MPEQYVGIYGQQRPSRRVGRATSCRILVLSNNHAMRGPLVNSNDYARASGNRGIAVKKGVSTFAAARHFFFERLVIAKKKKVKHCGERPM